MEIAEEARDEKEGAAPRNEEQAAQPVIAGGETAEPAPPGPVTGGIAAEGATLTDEGPLPRVDPAADLARIRTHPAVLILCFCVAAIIYTLFIPQILRYASPPTGDQPFYLMTTASIVQDGDLNLANNYANRDEDKFYSLAPRGEDFVGMGAPYPLPLHTLIRTVRPQGELYNYHHPGLSLLLAPAWIIGAQFQYWWPATIVFMCLVAALVSVNMLLFAHETTGKLWIALVVWLVVAFSHPLMTYSYMIFTELTTGLLVLYAVRRLAMGWGANGPWRLLLVGLCIAYLPCVQWRYVAIAGPLFLYAMVQFVRYRRSMAAEKNSEFRIQNSEVADIGRGESGTGYAPSDQDPKTKIQNPKWTGLAFFLAPLAISGGLILWYHYFLFGQPTPPPDASEFGSIDTIFHWPWAGMEELTRFVTTAFAHLYDQQFGLLIHAPVYILAVVGIIAMFRSGRGSDRRLLAAIGLIALPTVFMIVAFQIWQGSWSPPSRFLTTLIPLLAAPLAMGTFALRRSFLYWPVLTTLTVIGYLLVAARLHHPFQFWPESGPTTYFSYLATWQDLPFNVDLRDRLPSFDAPNAGRFAFTTGWLVGTSVLIVLLFYLLMSRQRVGAGDSPVHAKRLPVAAQGGFWAVALLVIGSGWLLMNGEYLQHKTTFVEQSRRLMEPPLRQPMGIAYLNGKLYLAEYGDRNSNTNGSVAEMDPSSGTLRHIQPWSTEGTIRFAFPGDVKTGPDGLLYVLNNGPGQDALWAMKADGEVVRRIALPGKSDISTALNFGPDGSIYVNDLIGGSVAKYSPDGRQMGVWTGQTGIFNNPGGVAVTQDGNVYVSEGYEIIQVLDPKGQFLRSYKLRRQPIHLEANGKWVDITNAGELMSIDTERGVVQRGYFPVEGVPMLDRPTGLAYAPNNTLYVLDGIYVIEYKVEH